MNSGNTPTVCPVPDRLSDVLDPEWLSSALADIPAGFRVADVATEDELTTVASKIRFRVRAVGPDGESCERAYCVKGHFDDKGYDSLGGETRFYRHIAPTLDVRTPRAHYTGIDAASGRCMIIMDDVIAGGGRFLSAHQPYSMATIRQTLGQLARLHGATWGERGDTGDGWLTPRICQLSSGYSIDYLQELLDDGRAAGLPAALRDAPMLVEALSRLAAVDPTCVIHGDAHSGNAYLDSRGVSGWLDWQVVQAGHWATDVSYHLATALDVEDRRAHEQELLRYYLGELSLLVDDPPEWEEAWDRYRRHFPYGYFLWTITRISSRQVVLIHIPRIATAMDDHSTLELLGVM